MPKGRLTATLMPRAAACRSTAPKFVCAGVVRELQDRKPLVGERHGRRLQIADAGADRRDAARAGVLPGARHIARAQRLGRGFVELQKIDAPEALQAAIQTARQRVVGVVDVGCSRVRVPVLAELRGDAD